MRSKDYLLQIWVLDEYIANKKDEIARLKESAKGFGGGSSSEKVQTSPVPDKLEKGVIAYIDMEMDLEAELIEIEAQRNAIIKTIELLPRPEYTVIYKIYVKYMTYDECGESLKPPKGYSYVSKKHSRGIKLLQEILDERDERIKGSN